MRLLGHPYHPHHLYPYWYHLYPHHLYHPYILLTCIIRRWISWQIPAAWCQLWQQMWPLCHPLSNIFELVSWRSDNEDGYDIFNRWWLWLMMIYIGGHWPKQWAGLAWPNSYWWEFCHFVCLCLCLSMSLSFYVFAFFSFFLGHKMIWSCNDDGKAVRHPSSYPDQ